jgi:hypothetical protein
MDNQPNPPDQMGGDAGCVIRITHIKFNFDDTAHSADALNIRVDRMHEVEVPEWNQRMFLPVHSKAAYALEPTRNRTIFIQCRFEITPSLSTGTVRARGGGILGAIDALTIRFVNGVSSDLSHGGDPEFVQIPLRHQRFDGITRSDIRWDWSYRCPSSQQWVDMDEPTLHRIYVVLDVPPAPWSQTDLQIYPWTRALDYAIVRNGIADPSEAAALVVQRVNGEPLQYDIWGGRPFYWNPSGPSGTFNIDAWLGGFTEGPIVNCYDCASAVTTFSNVLGCQLTYQFHDSFGCLNPVFPIGRGLCNNPFYGIESAPYNVPLVGVDDHRRTFFSNHAYGKQAGQNYDACMRGSIGCLAAIGYFVLAMFVLVGTLGFAASVARRLLMRGSGWLIDVSQRDYNNIVVDRSTPLEAAFNGGVPATEPLSI